VATHFIRCLHLIRHTYLSWHRHAHLARDLVRVLDWLLVALSVSLGMALGSSGVTCLASISFTLNITLAVFFMMLLMMALIKIRLLSNNFRATVISGVVLMAAGRECLHALLNISGVHNLLADSAGYLALVLNWLLVALLVLLGMTLRSTIVAVIASISFTFVESSITFFIDIDNLGVMANKL